MRACGGSSTAGGTGGRARIRGKESAARPGRRRSSRTPGARRGQDNKDLRDHGWFTFFAPRDNPEIAGVVFLEHGIHGANAASVAKHILDDLFREEGRQAAAAAADARRDAAGLSDRFARGGGGRGRQR